jgi:hypothetical protein
MLKLLTIDASGRAPFPEVDNPMLDKLNGLMTIGGYSLEGNFPKLTLWAKDGYESPEGLPDYFTVGLLNIMSSKLKATLQLLRAELEFFPVTINYRGKNIETQYFIGNPLLRIKGIDLSQSIVEIDEEIGDALFVKRLVLDESRFERVKFAVVDEIQYIAVQEEVALAVMRADCTGCVFVDPISIKY